MEEPGRSTSAAFWMFKWKTTASISVLASYSLNHFLVWSMFSSSSRAQHRMNSSFSVGKIFKAFWSKDIKHIFGGIAIFDRERRDPFTQLLPSWMLSPLRICGARSRIEFPIFHHLERSLQ